jgi:hypothetical protein
MMERITTQRFAEPVADALGWLPPRLREMAGADVFCGDPLFAGLHSFLRADDGRSYRDTAHVCYPPHVRDRRSTVVFTEPPDWYTVIHEFGHVIDWHLSERAGEMVTLNPVTAYARTNRFEAFAEAFTAWFYPLEEPYFVHDQASREFFDRLAWGGW